MSKSEYKEEMKQLTDIELTVLKTIDKADNELHLENLEQLQQFNSRYDKEAFYNALDSVVEKGLAVRGPDRAQFTNEGRSLVEAHRKYNWML